MTRFCSRTVAFRLTRRKPPYPPLPQHHFRAWPDPDSWQEGLWVLLIALATLGLVLGIGSRL
jgi:hypothetical protein